MKNNKIGKISEILTIFGISIGVAGVILTSEISRVGAETIKNEILDMGTSSIAITKIKTSADNILGKEVLNSIRKITDNSYTAPFTMNYGETMMRGLTARSCIIGADTAFKDVLPIKLMYGRFFQRSDIDSHSRVCIIDDKMARDYYKRENIVGKYAEISINGVKKQYEIIGIVKSGGTILHSFISSAVPYIAYLPYTVVNENTGENEFNQIIVQSNENEVKYYADKIDKKINGRASNRKYSVSEMTSESEMIMDLLYNIQKILSLIAGIALLVSGLSVMTVMIIYVKDKTTEIGIKKAIGASEYAITGEFIAYSCKLSFKGILYGIVSSVLILYIVSRAININYTPNVWSILKISILTFGISIIFSAYPTYKAALLNPIDALNNNE